MADDSDQILFHAYVRNRCESSFSELVHRHVDFVHSTALRIVRDPNLAEDVTQRVFLALAQHAAKLQGRASLTGWLHETARNLAINTVRSEKRRRQREQEAAAMNPLDSNDSDTLWEQIAPRLDEALAQLSAIERDVILWRYFERRTAEQIGGRLGLTAEAAQKRVARALERLRGILAARGLTAPTASLAALLSAQALHSAPVGLAASAITTASAAAVLPAASTLQILMASTKVKIGLAAVAAASITTPLVLQHQTNSRLRDEIARLRIELATPPPAQASDTSELERLRAEHEELLRLRGQVTQLRQQLARQPKAPTKVISGGRDKPAADDLAFESENAKTLLAKAPGIPMIPAKEFRNAGYDTPLASLHTMNWAAVNRDTNVMRHVIGLEPEARTRADELFAQMPEAIRQKYGSVDALLVDWRMNLADPPEAFRVLSQREDGPDTATLTVQFQYPNMRVRENELSFYHDQDGVWRQVMPSQVMDKLPYIISGQTQSTASGK
ncbi:MAG: sigma-70 family RNA polymerase sigma factor [Verrucomicrobia subdivision 3 bacterium]|nr:sigma-70 family RNA polymerase sigma factor [Limisphaerales bacterium]